MQQQKIIWASSCPLGKFRTMSDLYSTNASLLYFPTKQFSPRFGDCFFTVSILSFKKMRASSTLCSIGDVIFYEIEVKRGRLTWTVLRRYNEFAALYKSLEKEEMSTSDVPTSFPKKSVYSCLIYDKKFLELRRKELEVILDKILTAASTRSVAITNFTAVTTFLELSVNHSDHVSFQWIFTDGFISDGHNWWLLYIATINRPLEWSALCGVINRAFIYTQPMSLSSSRPLRHRIHLTEDRIIILEVELSNFISSRTYLYDHFTPLSINFHIYILHLQPTKYSHLHCAKFLTPVLATDIFSASCSSDET